MDFASMGRTLAANTGTTMHLVAPDGVTPLYAIQDDEKGWIVTTDPEAPGAKPCRFTVVSQDSKAHRRRRHEVVDALRKQQKTLKSEQVEQEAMRVVAAAVTGWENIPWSDGKDQPGYLMEFSNENLLKFLDLCQWNYQQVQDFIAERTNFLTID